MGPPPASRGGPPPHLAAPPAPLDTPTPHHPTPPPPPVPTVEVRAMSPLHLPAAQAIVTPQVEVIMEVEEGEEKEGLSSKAGERGRELERGLESSSQKLPVF